MRIFCGALVGIFVTGLLMKMAIGETAASPLLIAPMGASAVLLFAVPSSPLAQPWSIIGGNMTAAFIGITCALWIDDILIAATLAVALSIGAMLPLRCLHPPAGAVALTAVLGGPAVKAAGYGFALWPVGINSLLMLATALAFNNLTGRRYPHLAPLPAANPHGTTDPLPMQRVGFTAADLEAALARRGEVVDVGTDHLDTLLHEAEMQAYHRRFGEIRCADIMSRDVASVAPEASLHEAWTMLCQHHIKALPVVAEDRNVVGIITQTDFMENAAWGPHGELHFGLGRRLRHAMRPRQSLKRTVAEAMSTPVRTADPETPIARLVPMMADAGLHHLPIVDEQGKLAGIVTQSDLIAALYHGTCRNGFRRLKPPRREPWRRSRQREHDPAAKNPAIRKHPPQPARTELLREKATAPLPCPCQGKGRRS
ncbi:HPP family protein [Pseudaminobacter salicylatoxidans]|uniref:HPP family protein n=1 Tax=Pseudaminobacter salicylatoxidans TaxID=93369 RepID=UPI0002F0D8E5|nr:HPP family protein [Pseudaminobacter salicylatoxidans]